jgi:phosphoenolpyruvate carboxykinase (GTP)
VLKWVFERVDGEAGAVDTAIGRLPRIDDIDTEGLEISDADPQAIRSVDAEGWRAAVPQIREHYAQFDSRLPAQLHVAVDTLEARL